MKVAILGAGAMGALVGSCFHKGGAEVWLVDPFEAHIKKIAEEGLTINLTLGGKRVEKIKMNAVTNPEEAGVCDVVVILVKGMYTKSAVEGAKALFDENTFVLTLQNGVGNAEILSEIFGENRVGYGVLNLASVLVGPGEINANYRTDIEGSYNIHFNSNVRDENTTALCKKIEKILNDGGFKTLYSEDAEMFIWHKLITNCCVNLTCAMTRLTMGQLFRAPDGAKLHKEIIKELCAVANAKGIPLDFEKEWKDWHHSQTETDWPHYPSAAQDVFNQRKTEVDFLNGAISREGDKFGIETPVNDTIVMLSHIIENTYDIQYKR
ncbi:MAG: 2-dehydropantoate 2-reductase [Eubacteriaceae bacterium]|nr:2-dehydropantoate 2-reductase [Eubacteriaceae bacterium]